MADGRTTRPNHRPQDGEALEFGDGQTQLSVLRGGLSEYASRCVLQLIQEEELWPGDRLPTMKALAKRFSVATPTMREALRRLQANGVVEIRHGSGVYVRNTHERMLLANPRHRGVEANTILHLLDARLLIEPSLTEITAREADDAHVTVLGRILEEAEQYLVGNDVMLHRTNMGFHRAIANSSGNPILAQAVDSLIELYPFEQLAIISFYNDRTRDHEEHLAILAAIRDRDAVRARDLMYRHIRDVKSVVESRFMEIGDNGKGGTQ